MKVDVLIEINGQSLIVGELNETETRGHQTTSFTFSDEWLSNPAAFEFDPNLVKSKAPHYPKSGKKMFSCQR